MYIFFPPQVARVIAMDEAVNKNRRLLYILTSFRTLKTEIFDSTQQNLRRIVSAHLPRLCMNTLSRG